MVLLMQYHQFSIVSTKNIFLEISRYWFYIWTSRTSIGGVYCIECILRGEKFLFLSTTPDLGGVVLLVGDCSACSRCQKCWETHILHTLPLERRAYFEASSIKSLAPSVFFPNFVFWKRRAHHTYAVFYLPCACGLLFLQRRRKSDLQCRCVRELFILRRRRGEDWCKNGLERQQKRLMPPTACSFLGTTSIEQKMMFLVYIHVMPVMHIANSTSFFLSLLYWERYEKRFIITSRTKHLLFFYWNETLYLVHFKLV